MDTTSNPALAPIPQPLQATPIPAFLSKTFDLVDEPSLDPLISWGSTGHSFVVWDPANFATNILPHHFKHNNFASFVRQLNTYGFRKVDPDRCEFAHEDFIRGKRHYLKNIHRRRSTQGQHTGSTAGSPGDAPKTSLEGEIEQLKKDKTLLMQELVRLQQEHRGRMCEVEAVKQRLVAAEQMQKKVISFLAKLLRNPVFLSRLQNMNKQKGITSPRMKRKFVKHSQAEDSDDSSHEGHIVKYDLDLQNICSTMRSVIPTVNEFNSDNLLQDKVERVGHSMNDKHSEEQNMPTNALEEELVQPLNHIEIGGSSLGSLEYEDASFKENDVLSHQFQNSLLTCQQYLEKESTLSDFMSPKVDDIVKQEDGWDVDFNVSSGMDTSKQDLWMNLTNYDDQELGFVGGFSNLWDWESQEPVVNVGVANSMGEEYSSEHLASQAELPQNDLYKNSHA